MLECFHIFLPSVCMNVMESFIIRSKRVIRLIKSLLA